MSWSGTVTCSHCYTRGHNKRKCPALSEQIKDQYEGAAIMAEKERAAGNENDATWYEERAEGRRQQYMKRTKIDLATGKTVTNKAAKAERMKNVTCGYCSQRGHTRRVCEVVKRDKLVFIEESRRARVAALEVARETGIGVGSMIPIRISGYHGPDNEWGHYTSLRYVKNVDWSAVTSERPAMWVYHVEARKIGAANQSRWTSRDKVEKMVSNFEDARGYALAEGQKTPAASLIPSFDPPAGWLDCEPSTIDVARHFPTKGNKYEKQRRHDYRWPNAATSQVIRDLGLEEHWKDDGALRD
jgi:hypothetical protein